ncbi:MAG: type I-B CRISPR-associated protein Cas5b [Candidatus Heimdallarchaeum aukensis]|uniref:Type I-B CRISPR-associated protein Cas5b n=1 Tax=Candidatus Heimdallarchaeum aukensis TaxID=2876573 RepID=A0A9Y1BKX3_9ARCH|nr:MAG: type I-B CRISPR-associated protein Cas5b [Candidatus Heimdallarchaeum aukensis]
MKRNLLSFIIFSDFGTFSKPDITETKLTYDIIPKPSVLGILGALIGLEGYREKKQNPEFIDKLSGIRIGITPLKLKKGSKAPYKDSDFENSYSPLRKEFIQFINFHGYGSYETGGNLIVNEQILIKPAYRIYLEKGTAQDNIFAQLKKNLQENRAHFMPYMGKNEFPLSIIYEGEYEYKEITSETETRFKTIVFNDIVAKDETDLIVNADIDFFFYQNYPIGFRENQYVFKTVVFSNSEFLVKETITHEYILVSDENGETIFLF